MATEVEQSSSLGENGGGEECGVLEQAVIERRNLLNLVKLTVKVLIESTMRTGRPLDDTDTHLQQLFAALEHSLRHRLKGKEMSYALTQTSYVDNIKHECKYVCIMNQVWPYMGQEKYVYRTCSTAKFLQKRK